LLLPLSLLPGCIPVPRLHRTAAGRQAPAPSSPSPPPGPCAAGTLSGEDLLRQARAGIAVVRIPEGEGIGFVVRQQGGDTLLLTSARVLGTGAAVVVRWPQGEQDEATVAARGQGDTPLTDLALLQVKGERGQVLPLREGAVAAGSDTLTVGSPGGPDVRLSPAVVSPLPEDSRLLQLDPALPPGNAGGPVLDRSGCVVGMVSALGPNGEGGAVALASGALQAFLRTPPTVAEEGGAKPEGPNCWFPSAPDAPELQPAHCRIRAGTDGEGRQVVELQDPGGLSLSVVLSENGSAEVIQAGERRLGRWWIDRDGDVRVSLEGAAGFAFRSPENR
jgi:hypothetical protein